jgi:orotate phosphoribosyltransferase
MVPTETENQIVVADVPKILSKIGALRFGAFKLTSGKMSPYYVDLRLVPSFPSAFHKVCEYSTAFIKENIGEKMIERVAGIPVAGIPFASMIAYNLGKPFLYIRKGVRLHGRQRGIEGVLSPGDRVLLIDDLITTGLSLAKAAKVVTAEGGVVNDAFVLLNREEGGKERLKRESIELHSLMKISTVAASLHEIGAIDEEQLKTILKQIKKRK